MSNPPITRKPYTSRFCENCEEEIRRKYHESIPRYSHKRFCGTECARRQGWGKLGGSREK